MARRKPTPPFDIGLTFTTCACGWTFTTCACGWTSSWGSPEVAEAAMRRHRMVCTAMTRRA